jgi:type 1 glutamine amidotransferase
LAYCVEYAENVKGLRAEIVAAWPDTATLDDVATIVFSGDRFPPAEMPDGAKIMTDLTKLMDRGCGIVCFHYATGLNVDRLAEDRDHPLLRWMGGYFATGKSPNRSIAKVFDAAIEPGSGDHPVLRGWKSFALRDEPYVKNYFGPNGMEKNVTALATTTYPPEAPQKETVAWAVSRPDGGRGVGVVMPHFYKNWQNDDLRMLIVNAIVWTARHEVPAEGVRTKLPSLETFQPTAVDPQPRSTKK